MKKTLSLILTVLLSAMLFASCGTSDLDSSLEHLRADDAEYDYTRFEGQNITINVANWGEYLCIDEPDMLDVNEQFEALTGIKVNYQMYSTNEELYAKLKNGGSDYDIIIPSDYTISRLINDDMLEKLDFSNIPNFEKYIDDNYKNPEYDPTNEYSVPYTWGMVCLIYNKTMVDEAPTSWSALWDEKYSGNILMFNNPRDAFGIAQEMLGVSLNSEDTSELDDCFELLESQQPVVQAYVMDEIFDKMEGGSAALAPYYVGDAVVMMESNPDLDYVIPEEGTNLFVDAICIPKGAKNKEAAEMYINFLCETEIALANCEYIGYSTPHTGAYELLDDDVKNDARRYPSDEFIATKTETFRALSEDASEYMQNLWNKLKF
ncbi:MAG: ABC transporter substrate-binding protein [Clostridia bacterium]|nr:ABC transporter substrate-binding protein [Clostridia bacterium]